MDSVFIRDLRVQGILGIHPWERERPQEILINIAITTETDAAQASDAIADCVDYQTLALAVKTHVEVSRRLTVEALAGDLARIILAVPGVAGTRIRVEKPTALDFCAGVGVEIERRASAFVSRHAEFASEPPSVSEDVICVGLGSNTDAATNLSAAVHELQREFTVEAVSGMWESADHGEQGPPYWNAAALIRTVRELDDLKSFLKNLERKLGRRPVPGSNSVAIDLDLLLHRGSTVRSDLWSRAYCAVPAAELLPNLPHPETQELLTEAAQRLARRTPIRRLHDLSFPALNPLPIPAEAPVLPKDPAL